MDNMEEALLKVKQRRINNELTRQEHVEEIYRVIPEIAEINRQLVQVTNSIIAILRKGENVDQKIADLKEQNLSAQKMIRDSLVMHGYPKDYMDMKYTCEKCHDTGYLRDKFCSCVLELHGKIATKELNKSVQFEDKTFDNFSLEYYRDKRTDKGESCYTAMEHVLDFCKEYGKHFDMHKSSVLMFGKTGLGKTHLSLAIANEVVKQGYSVLYDSTINFLRQIEKEHFGKEKSDIDTLECMLNCDLLILDDLGTEFKSPFYQSAVYNLVNTRMNREKPTIISSNLDYNGLSAQYEERVTSRIFTTYVCLNFVGQDVRVLKRQQSNGPIR